MTDEVVDALAVFRLTRLVTTDTFPPVQRLRWRVLQRWPADDWRSELATCDWCLSFWIALGVAAVRNRRTWRVAATVLAASAVTGLLADK